MVDAQKKSSQGRRRREDPVRAAARRRRHLLALATALLVTFISAVPGGLVWTDHLDLTKAGARITSWSELDHAFTLSQYQFRESRLGDTPEQDGGPWRPAAIIANTAQWWLTGGCAACMHALSVLWHGLTVFGLYVLGRRILARRSHGKTLAFWAALLFAVHPLTTIPVAFLGRLDLLIGTALSVMTLVFYSRLPATSGSSSRGKRRWLILLPPMTLAAVLSHESALILPVVALLLSWYEMRERGRHGFGAIGRDRRLGLGLILASLAVYVSLRMQWVGFNFNLGVPPDTTLTQTIATGLSLFWHGIAQVFFPGEPVISDSWAIATGLTPSAMAGLLGLIFGVGVTLWGLRHHHPAAVGICWFLAWYLPQSGLVPFTHLHDDTNLYPAAWGVALAIVILLYRLWRPLGRQLMRNAEALAFTPLVIVLALLTALSSLRFRDDIALFTGEIDLDPYYLEGRVLLGKAALREGEPLLALNQGSLALEALSQEKRPSAHWPAAEAHLLIGRAQITLGLLDDALANLELAHQLAPHRAAPLYGIGVTKLKLQDSQGALTALQAADRRLPGDLNTQLRLGEALIREGETDAGLARLVPIIDAGKVDEPALLALTEMFMSRGETKAAISHLELALAQKDDPVLHARLAQLLWRAGRHSEAQDEIALALQRASENQTVQDIASEIMAGSPTLPGTL